MMWRANDSSFKVLSPGKHFGTCSNSLMARALQALNLAMPVWGPSCTRGLVVSERRKQDNVAGSAMTPAVGENDHGYEIEGPNSAAAAADPEPRPKGQHLLYSFVVRQFQQDHCHAEEGRNVGTWKYYDRTEFRAPH